MSTLDLTAIETAARSGAMTGELHWSTHYEGCEAHHWRCALLATTARIRTLEALIEREFVGILRNRAMPNGILYCTDCGAKATEGPVTHRAGCRLIGLLDEPEPEQQDYEPAPERYMGALPPRD